MDVKSGQLKDESKSELFSAPGYAQRSPTRATINALEVPLMVQFRVQPIIHLELHPRVQHYRCFDLKFKRAINHLNVRLSKR